MAVAVWQSLNRTVHKQKMVGKGAANTNLLRKHAPCALRLRRFDRRKLAGRDRLVA